MIRGSYQVAANLPCHLGENPLWNPDEGVLYWTDIDGQKIYRLDPATGEAGVACEPGMRVGGMTLQTDGGLALFGDDGKIAILIDGQLHPIFPGLPDEKGTRFNDVFADSVGRVFAGTMPKPERNGRLYRFEPSFAHTMVLDDIGCSNGMGLTPDGHAFYYTDTGRGRIYRFAYEPMTGEISEQTTFLQFGPGDGGPDGMTVDAEGNVWIAFWEGHSVRCFGPDGTEKARLDLPVARITAPVILPDGRMFITSAGGANRQSADDLAGSVFVVQLEVAGVPEHRSRLGGGAAD